MDKALDDVIGERQHKSGRSGGGRGPRRDNWSNDQPRKNRREDRQGIDDDWLHDRFDDASGDIRGGSRFRERRPRRSPELDRGDEGVKLRVENLHYDLTEDDLEDLFARIAPVTSLTLTYDRSGRSTGTAYVTYRGMGPAREAIKEFDGANANGQPIRLSIVPQAPARRSLLERVEDGRRGGNRGGGSRGPHRERSRSPRRSDVTKPPPAGVDRYIPGGNRSRSPPRRRRGGGGGGEGGRNDSRRGGGRRGGGERTGEGAPRPKKTQEQLDREMEDYWNKNADGAGTAATNGEQTAVAPAGEDMEIEMAE